eukprot:m.812777 g.812777  ORF g.812777 m.812777 type:complete len:1180 (-) comp59348_c0_seq5:135-3674(-)
MDRSRTLSDATSRGRPGADAASVHSSEGSVSEVPSPTSPTPHLEQGKKKKSFVKSLFSRLKSKKSDKNVTRTQDDLVEVDDVVEDDQGQGVRGRAYTTGAVDRTRALQAAPVRPSPPRETASTSTATLTTAAAERSTSRSTSRHHSHSRSDSPRDSSEQDASDHPIPHDLTEPAEEEGFNEQEDTRPSPRPRRTEIDMAAILATTRELDRSKSLMVPTAVSPLRSRSSSPVLRAQSGGPPDVGRNHPRSLTVGAGSQPRAPSPQSPSAISSREPDPAVEEPEGSPVPPIRQRRSAGGIDARAAKASIVDEGMHHSFSNFELSTMDGKSRPSMRAFSSFHPGPQLAAATGFERKLSLDSKRHTQDTSTLHSSPVKHVSLGGTSFSPSESHRESPTADSDAQSTYRADSQSDYDFEAIDRALHQLKTSGESAPLALDRIVSEEQAFQDAVEGIKMVKLYVHLLSGHDMIAMDRGGTSDPFCLFAIGERARYKSKKIMKTLNPAWDEQFVLKYPVDCEDALMIEVEDWDLGATNDFMGGTSVDLHSLEFDQPHELELKLEDTRQKRLPANLGSIRLIMTKRIVIVRADEPLPVAPSRSQAKRSMTTSTLQRSQTSYPTPQPPSDRASPATIASPLPLKKSARHFNLNLELIEATGIPAMNRDRLADVLVKFSVGKTKFSSKVRYATLHPIWKERFDIPLADPTQKIAFQVKNWDLLKNRPIGSCVVDLSQLPRNKTAELNVELQDAQNVKLRMLITIQETAENLSSNPSTSSMASFDGSREAGSTATKACGKLTVTVHQARDLKAKDLHLFAESSSDPYVELELGNTRVRTPTVPRSLNPCWNKTLEIEIVDIFDVLHVKVCADNKGKKPDDLGRLDLPLLQLENAESEWYVLKDKKLLTRYQGEIMLEFQLEYEPMRAYPKLIARKEANLLEADEKFKLHELVNNISRVKNIVLTIIRFAESIDGILCWKFGFAPSAISFLVWIWACFFLELYMLPLVLVFFLAMRFYASPPKQRSFSTTDEFQDEAVNGSDDDDEDDPGSADKDKAPKLNLKERLKQISEICLSIQVFLGKAASFCERVKNLTNWSVPLITTLVISFLFVASIVLAVIPVNYLLLAWGVKKFVMKGLQKYHPKFKKKTSVSVNELFELIGRLPSDIELLQRRRFAASKASARPNKSSPAS